jgi:hypothetical protein
MLSALLLWFGVSIIMCLMLASCLAISGRLRDIELATEEPPRRYYHQHPQRPAIAVYRHEPAFTAQDTPQVPVRERHALVS